MPEPQRDPECVFMSRREAAEKLGVSERTVYRYLRRGVLRGLREAGQCGVLARDVHALAAVTGSGDVEHATELKLLEAQLGELLQAANAAETILDAENDPLPLAPAELVSLFESMDHFAKHGWPPASEATLATMMLRLTASDLAVIEGLVGCGNPWAPFLEVAMLLTQQPGNSELEMLSIAARNHLIVLAAEDIESRSGRRQVSRRLSEIADIDRNYLRRTKRALATESFVTSPTTRDPSADLKEVLRRFEAEHGHSGKTPNAD